MEMVNSKEYEKYHPYPNPPSISDVDVPKYLYVLYVLVVKDFYESCPNIAAPISHSELKSYHVQYPFARISNRVSILQKSISSSLLQ